MTKKTKIVATIGPATESEKQLAKLFKTGVNVVRLNFSHNTHEWHQAVLNRARKVSKETGIRIAALQDLSGPKIRIGELPPEGIVLKKGTKLTLTTKKVMGNEKLISVNYAKLPQEVKKGDIIKIEDGKKTLLVEKTSKTEIFTKVIDGGKLTSHKGINLPGVELSISSLTAKDKKDVLFGIKNKVEFIAFSFVQTKKDVLELRRILNKHKSRAHIIAKIETEAAIRNFDDILEAVDGIMIARGDLAIEIGAEKVPLIQKEIIAKCNAVGKPVITATQMLDSMEHSPVPTRAEVSDIANAILDGTDAIMLSGETTVGKYPIEAVEVMTRIAQEVEDKYEQCGMNFVHDTDNVTDVITHASVDISDSLDASLVTLTHSGFTARMVARFKPKNGFIAISNEEYIANQLIIHYGCTPLTGKLPHDEEGIAKGMKKIAKENKVKLKKRIVFTKGNPFGKTGSTNALFVAE